MPTFDSYLKSLRTRYGQGSALPPGVNPSAYAYQQSKYNQAARIRGMPTLTATGNPADNAYASAELRNASNTAYQSYLQKNPQLTNWWRGNPAFDINALGYNPSLNTNPAAAWPDPGAPPTQYLNAASNSPSVWLAGDILSFLSQYLKPSVKPSATRAPTISGAQAQPAAGWNGTISPYGSSYPIGDVRYTAGWTQRMPDGRTVQYQA